MTIGVVKSFDRHAGLGFITPEDGGADVQVHVSAVERAGLARLEIGDRVRFDVSVRNGKRFAMNLQLL